MKKFSAFLILPVIFAALHADCFAISAQSAAAIDAASGRVLFSQDCDRKMGMASTTKIMTAICALESADVNSVATVSKQAYGVEGSSMYLVLGEKLTLENLLYGLMLVSGNDAATAVAEHVSGSVDKFAELMNKKAAEIGAYDSSFTNPHGLADKNHYTTAHDLAKITAYALKNPKFAEIVSTKTKSIPWKDHDYNRRLVNHNKFLSMYDGCIGVKTGFTKATGRCLVTAVDRGGMRIVCVTLNAPDDWNDHKSIYDSIFSEYKPCLLKSGAEAAATAEIKGGSAKSVTLVPESDIYLPLKDGEESSLEMSAEAFEDLHAPVSKGDVLGKLTVKIGGAECGEFPLVASENVEMKTVRLRPESGSFGLSLKKVFYLWITCFN